MYKQSVNNTATMEQVCSKPDSQWLEIVCVIVYDVSNV